jgi:hypothetical protein
MPASLYRLAGKSHHSEVSTQLQQDVSSEAVVAHVEQAQVVEPELVVEQTVADSNHVDDVESQTVETVETAEEVASQAQPTWEPTWTKSQLFDFAAARGLPVTATNTKSEIIALLNSKK